jgi:hypothetical protein
MPGAITPGGRIGDPSPVGTPGGKQNWVDRAGGLPTYIRMVAHALMRKGKSESTAIATAVATMKRWAAGGGNVSAKVQAAAAAALAEFEAKRGAAHVTKSLGVVELLKAETSSVGREMLATISKEFGAVPMEDLSAEHVSRAARALVRHDSANDGSMDSPYMPGADMDESEAKSIMQNAADSHLKVAWADLHRQHTSSYGYKRSRVTAHKAKAQIEKEQARRSKISKRKLTAKGRKKIKAKNFAVSSGKYPIHDESHARNALSRVSQHGTPEEKKKVRAAVKRKYPNIGKREVTISKIPRGVPGHVYHYKHGWIPVAGDVHEVDHGPGRGVTQYHIIDANNFGGGSAKVKVIRGSRSGGKFRKLDQVTATHKLSTLGPILDGHKFLGNKKKETPIPKKPRSSRGGRPSDGRQLVGHSFVGRARSTGSGGPMERKVRTPDGKIVWAEEGSALWARAQGRVKKRDVTLTKKEFNAAAKLVADSESVSGSVSKKRPKQSELTMQGSISKVDNEKKRVFGWASVGIRKDGQVVIDKQGDLIDDPEEMENAAYNFVLHSRDGGEMHIRKGVSTLIESFVITPEKREALGIPEGVLPQSAWWTGFQIHDDDVWKAVKSGKYKQFSVHGRGQRKSVN